jgi:ketosteroid isomerase-like protein
MQRWMVVTLLVPWVQPAWAQQAQNDAHALLLKTDTEWAAQAASGKDVEGIVSFWTDDAVVYPPREAPIVGKEAIRRYVSESLKVPGFSISWQPIQAVVSKSGDLGYVTGTNAFTFPDALGHLTTAHGRYVTVWRRDAGGRWRCAVDSWNEAPPAP